MTDLIFREATMADHPGLLTLEQNIIESERPYDANIKEQGVIYYDLEKFITDTETFLLVVESAGELVGSGYAQIRPSKASHSHKRDCYLGFIYLEPAHRGKALGQRILEHLKEWGLQQNMQHFFLDVYSQNVSAIRAYEKAGFNAVSVTMELVV